MGILLVRHAHAVQERRGVDDQARWLSRRGREQAREVADAVRERAPQLTRFLASPRVRAVQTAELFAQALGHAGEVESLAALSFTAPPEEAVDQLAALAADEQVAAFGHMPTIATIAVRLTKNSWHADFALCEALWIEQGRVVWSLAPR